MSTITLVIAFVGVKVALAILFWRATVKGLDLAERIEARKRAEREQAEELAAPLPPLEITRPAA